MGTGNMGMRVLQCVFGMLLLILSTFASAALEIEIIGAGENQVPVSIVPFGGHTSISQTISSVVTGDLQRTGLFRLIDPIGRSPHEPSDVAYPDWQARGADALVVGSVSIKADGQADARFYLLDVVKQAQMLGQSVTASPSQLRAVGHRIADLIYEKLTGDKGVFSTRIAYVNKLGARYRLIVADSDGYNEQTVLSQNQPIMSPAWSPDGSRLAYVSFESGHAAVYIQSVYSRQRAKVADFRGSNSAPAWSPDGRQLAIVLTRDGSSEIYLIKPDGSGLHRLTFNEAITTEPYFSPDGSTLLFTSDQGGNPQIYSMPVSGGTEQRMTFGEGNNFSPRYSPDGKSFVYTNFTAGQFYIVTQDVQTGIASVLTAGGWDKKPSFAPNGKLILFSSEARGRGILATVSSDGRVQEHMFTDNGDAREPVWGPYQ